MDTPTLQSPGTGGRSRFSKALPAPPPELGEASPTPAASAAWKIPRKPPALPKLTTTAFPLRKESIGARFIPQKPLESPLPALPSEAAPPRKMTSIPRKAVAQPPAPAPAPQPQTQTQPQHQPEAEGPLPPAKLKRVSSISSILSAYSGTSDDSVHRGSQGSVTTKNSEPSHSPGRGVAVDPRDKFIDSLGEFSGNPHSQELTHTHESNEAVGAAARLATPPPPPKDASSLLLSSSSSRATETRVGQPANPRSRMPKDPPPEAVTSSLPTPSTQDSSPRPEIWKRRASEPDASRGVPELTLPASHGSTVETTPSRSALPLPLHNEKKLSPSPASNQPPRAAVDSGASPAAPNPAALAGNDIGPPQQVVSEEEDEEMKNLMKNTARELVLRATGHKFVDDGSDDTTTSHQANEIEQTFKVLPRREPTPPPKDDPGPRPVPADREGWSKQELVPTSPDPFVARPGSSGLGKRRDLSRSGSPGRQPRPGSSGRQSRPGSSGRQSRPGSAGQGRVRNQASFTNQGKPDNNRDGAEPTQSPQPWTLASPPTLIPPSKHDLFELVTDLSADTTTPFTRSRPPVAHNEAADDTALSMVGEESSEAKALGYATTDKLSAADKAMVEEAVERFPRQALAPSGNGVFAAAPLAVHHFHCLSRHKQWVRAKNVHYSLACATCHAEDREWRAVCKTCSLRVCYQCAGRLTEHGDLSHMLEELQRHRQAPATTASQQPTVVVDADAAKPE